MIEKTKILQFIEKYNLGGAVEAVVWNIAKDKITTEFQSEDCNVIGNIESDNFGLVDGKIGIFNTSHLIKMLSGYEHQLEIGYITNKNGIVGISLSNENHYSYFATQEWSLIPKAPILTFLPEFEASIPIDSYFRKEFINCFNTLVDKTDFMVEDFFDHHKLTFGVKVNANVNTTSFKIEGTGLKSLNEGMYFNSEYMKSILLANKFGSGNIDISNKGLIRVVLDDGNIKSTYYLPKNNIKL